MPAQRIKMRSKQRLLNWHVMAIVLAGTVVRFMYGCFSKAWLAAPDQLAWGFGIDEMLHNHSWNYTQLTHAPHEGGSFFISLLSIVFRPLQSVMPPLSFAALLVDSFSRLVQVKVTQKLLGDRTATGFGIWTILSIPLLLPWGTVNFGLHALFSFIPFVFVYIADRYRSEKYLPVYLAVICGVAVSLLYDSLILPIISLVFLVTIRNTAKNKVNAVALFVLVFSITMVPHLLTRISLYRSNPLLTDPVLSVRGLPVTVFSVPPVMNLCSVWFSSLPGSFLLSSTALLSPMMICTVVFLCIVFGIWFYIKSTVTKRVKLVSLGVILLFIVLYALSPFYGAACDNHSYVYYRHLSYIVPFITVVMIHGFFHSGKWKLPVMVLWIFLCGAASIQYIYTSKKTDRPAYRAAGWILTKKYGNDVARLLSIRSVAEMRYRNELTIGFGWGLSALVLSGKQGPAPAEQLVQVILQFSREDRPLLVEGIHYSFSTGITPVLDQKMRPLIDQILLTGEEVKK